MVMQADEERTHHSVILSLTWLQDSTQEYCEGNILEFFTPFPLIFLPQRELNLSFHHGVNCTGDYSTYLNVFKLQFLFLNARRRLLVTHLFCPNLYSATR
jgi:hypothetical protein